MAIQGHSLARIVQFILKGLTALGVKIGHSTPRFARRSNPILTGVNVRFAHIYFRFILTIGVSEANGMRNVS